MTASVGLASATDDLPEFFGLVRMNSPVVVRTLGLYSGVVGVDDTLLVIRALISGPSGKEIIQKLSPLSGQ